MDPRERNRLCDEVRASGKALVDHVTYVVDHDVLGKVTYRAPSLIEQLREAVANGREVGSPQRSATRPLPISIAAHDLLTEIDTVCRRWTVVTGPVENKIWLVCNRIGHCQSESWIRTWAETLSTWVTQVMELFDPPKRYHISAPCPVCTKATAKVYHVDDKEYVMVPALQILRGPHGSVCQCMSCGAQWPEDRFSLLARAIGVDGEG